MKFALHLKFLRRNFLIVVLVAVFPVLPVLVGAGQKKDSTGNGINEPNSTTIEKIRQLNALAGRLNPDSTNQALVYAHEAYLLSLNQPDKKLQIQSLLNLSEGYLYNDFYEQALQYAFSALDFATEIKNTSLLADCNTNLGWIFYDTESPGFAMQYHLDALHLNLKTGDQKKIAKSFNAIGLIFQMQNSNDSAKIYFKKALQIAHKEGMRSLVSAAFNNIGICENFDGNYATALGYFKRALEDRKNLESILSIAEIQNQMAYSYLKLKEFSVADSLLKDSRRLINESTSNSRKEKLLDNLHISAQLFEALGKYRAAFESLREYTEISNQIISNNKTDVVATLKLKRETQEKETQLKELNLSKELRVFQRNAFVAGLILLFIIGFLVYSRMRQSQRRRNELEEVKQKMIKQDLQNTLMEKEALDSRLKFKNSDLKNYALYISQRNELIRNFIEELVSIGVKNLKKEDADQFQKLIKKFQQNLEINSESQIFSSSVDEMNKDFFYNLLQRFPELTENERRLCAQIRLNLNMKEIASINNISVKSVEMARYRLRKRFNLQTSDDLHNFLKTF